MFLFQTPSNENAKISPTLVNGDSSASSGRNIAPASLWTRPKLQEFINHVKRDASSVIVVGRGETVTIRVPTHENGEFFKFNIQLHFSPNQAFFSPNKFKVKLIKNDCFARRAICCWSNFPIAYRFSLQIDTSFKIN